METLRKVLIALHLMAKGCIKTTEKGTRCTRKHYPYCKVHDPNETIIRPRKEQVMPVGVLLDSGTFVGRNGIPITYTDNAHADWAVVEKTDDRIILGQTPTP